MELIRFSNNQKYDLGPIVAALGEFDGLHLAHRTLINKACGFAREMHAKSAVFSFDPHPDFVLKKRINQGYLTPLSEKIRNLSEMGIDYFVIIPFSEEFSRITYQDFEKMVLGAFDIRKIVVGFDYRYGYRGIGNSETLKVRYPVFVLERIEMFHHKVGSNEVREHLLQGNIREVTALLGRYYRIVGKVIPGSQFGRQIGVRTANVALDESFQILKKGVYAVYATVEGIRYPGVCNIGNNPTVNYTEQLRLEVHIFDFYADIYDKIIMVDFVAFLRGEIKYNTVDAMVAQIQKDIAEAKEILEKEL